MSVGMARKALKIFSWHLVAHASSSSSLDSVRMVLPCQEVRGVSLQHNGIAILQPVLTDKVVEVAILDLDTRGPKS